MGDSINNLPPPPNGKRQTYGASSDLAPDTGVGDPRDAKEAKGTKGVKGAKHAAEAEGEMDSFELGGQPSLFSLAGTGGRGETRADPNDPSADDLGTGDDPQDTGVQPGGGDMIKQLAQEYGPLGAMMMLLFSGGLGGGGGGGGGLDGIGGGGGGGGGGMGLGGGGDPADSVTDPNANPELMDATQGTGDSRNNQGTGNTGGVNYQQVSGSLWGGDGTGVTGATGSTNGIADSIQQTGNVGDCYFLASLSGAAAQDPNSVKNMVRQDPNGNPHDYQVRFYAKDPQTQQMKEEWVSVNDDLPTTSGGQGGAAGLPKDASGQPIIGPALIEKAFAKFNDEHQLTQQEGVQAGAGYNGIGNGGIGNEALEAITGKASSTVGDQNATGSLAAQGVGDDELTQALQQANPPSHTPTVAGSVQNPGNGVVGSHEYTVLGTYQQNGQTMVSLRNPWGTNDPKNPSDPNQGVISISLAQFKKDFGTVVSAGGQGSGNTGNTGNTGSTAANTSTMAAFNLRNQFMRA